jgi:hypothetical protein
LDSDSDSWGLFSLESGFSPVETDGSIYDASQQESPFPSLCFSGVEFLSQGKEMAFMRELDFRMGFFLSIWSGPLWASSWVFGLARYGLLLEYLVWPIMGFFLSIWSGPLWASSLLQAMLNKQIN